MNWTELDEKDLLIQWAHKMYSSQLSEAILSMPDNMVCTYWQAYDGGQDITAYEFENMQELKQMLSENGKENFFDEIAVALSVAAYKRKPSENVKDEHDKNGAAENEEKYSIPEFIYAF